jgi:hypothetical protein
MEFARVEEIPELVHKLESNAALARSIASAGHALVFDMMQKEKLIRFAQSRLTSVACRAYAPPAS